MGEPGKAAPAPEPRPRVVIIDGVDASVVEAQVMARILGKELNIFERQTLRIAISQLYKNGYRIARIERG